MSSDANSLDQASESPAAAYVYPLPRVPGGKASASGESASTLERLWGAEVKPPGSLSLTEEQMQARETLARKAGREEGLAQGLADFEKRLSAEKQAIVQAAREFALRKDAYFQKVEGEVVGLALAIARKILHREAQVDPLLLAGVVRVGLDKIAAGTRVRLKVHPDQVAGWQKFFSQQHEMQSVPELLGDRTLEPGHCLLETELGSTDLTLEAQLKEVEQGLFDILAQRPEK